MESDDSTVIQVMCNPINISDYYALAIAIAC